jgi:hypothetical protein
VKRKAWMRFVPFSKLFRCDNCSAYCYEIFFKNIFQKIDLNEVVNNEYISNDKGQRSAERHRLPLKLQILQIYRDGKELEYNKDYHIYSLNFSATGIAIRTEMHLQENDQLFCKAEYHDFHIEAIVKRSYVNSENGIVYGCSLAGGGIEDFSHTHLDLQDK